MAEHGGREQNCGLDPSKSSLKLKARFLKPNKPVFKARARFLNVHILKMPLTPSSPPVNGWVLGVDLIISYLQSNSNFYSYIIIKKKKLLLLYILLPMVYEFYLKQSFCDSKGVKQSWVLREVCHSKSPVVALRRREMGSFLSFSHSFLGILSHISVFLILSFQLWL